MQQGKCRLGLLLIVFILTLTNTLLAQQSGTVQRVFIETARPYDRVISAIEANGGTVLYQYTYVDGIGAELPDAAIDEVRKLVGAAAITKDEDIALPQPVNSTRSHGAASQESAASTADTAGQPSRISN